MFRVYHPCSVSTTPFSVFTTLCSVFTTSFTPTPPMAGPYADYEEFDAWLLWDMYEHPDQAVPVRRKFWKREGTLPEEAGVEAG